MTGIFSRSVTFFGKITPALLLLASAGFLSAQTPAQLSFTNLTQQYNGDAKFPTVHTTPGGLQVQLDLIPRNSSTVFSNIPASPLPLSFSGNPLASYQGFGDAYNLGGTLRNLESIDAVLVNWAKASDFPTIAAANPNGYPQTIRLIVYNQGTSGYQVAAQKAQTVIVPWRPETLADGSPYPWNGTAFNVRFNFPLGTTISGNVAVIVTFNTRTGGFNPTGVSGPADQLNVALSGATPSIGTNPNAALIRYENNTFNWVSYSGMSSLFTIRATVPDPPTEFPINAGHYAVNATVVSPGYTGSATTDLIITPVPATITLGNLKQAATGTPKTISVNTNPSGLSYNVLYDNRTSPPSDIGTYPFTIEITSPNYQGRTTGTLTLGRTLATYLKPWTDAGMTQSGPAQDPDKDGSSNLLEYAFGTNPTSGTDIPSLKIARGADHSLLTYSRQLDSIDLLYEIQASSDLINPSSWVTLNLPVTQISTANRIETVRMKVDQPTGENFRFFRLKVTQIQP